MTIKVLKILLICFIINIICFSCCRNTEDYIVINDYKLSIKDIYNLNRVYGNLDTVYSEKLLLVSEFEYDFISQFRSPGIFMNECYALKCSAGANGLKRKITQITISSNNIFNNFQANTSLNDIVICSYLNNEGKVINNVSIDQLISAMNSMNDYFLNHDFKFYINEKPESIKKHKFSLMVKFDDNRILKKESNEIIWI